LPGVNELVMPGLLVGVEAFAEVQALRDAPDGENSE
jgi:hypothetical protein